MRAPSCQRTNHLPPPRVAAVLRAHQFLTFSVPPALQAGVAAGLAEERAFIDAHGPTLAAKRAPFAAALARCGRLLDDVAGDAEAVAARRDEVIAAMAATRRRRSLRWLGRILRDCATYPASAPDAVAWFRRGRRQLAPLEVRQPFINRPARRRLAAHARGSLAQVRCSFLRHTYTAGPAPR